MTDWSKWLEKHELSAENILYLYRQSRRTVFHREDGEEFTPFAPLQVLLALLPEADFLRINKGVAVNRARIINIDTDGVYTMSDGRTFLEKCTLLNEMPLAYCVIELVFNAEGHGVDFIFRYCNAEMAVMEGVPVEKMLNRSFYEVFRNGDKKWLVAYADVALNGTKRILHDYSPEIGKYLTIYCYQPTPGFCACVLQKADA